MPLKGSTTFNHDLGELSGFTLGRWFWGERHQLASRYIKFDLARPLGVAATTKGSEGCFQVAKVSQCQYNKVFSLKMGDGREVAAKLPYPNTGRPTVPQLVKLRLWILYSPSLTLV